MKSKVLFLTFTVLVSGSVAADEFDCDSHRQVAAQFVAKADLIAESAKASQLSEKDAYEANAVERAYRSAANREYFEASECEMRRPIEGQPK